MFVTVLCGDGKTELVNLNCKLINFIDHLKEKCGLDSEECVDLMDSSGRVMSLEEKQHSLALASCVLTERRLYVLLRVTRDITGGRKYTSLFHDNSPGQSHPEVAELLKKLNVKAERSRRGKASKSKMINKND